MAQKTSQKILSAFYILALLVSFMDAAVYLSMRSIWSFINKTVGSPMGLKLPWAHLFFILFILCFVYTGAVLVLHFKRMSQGPGKSPILNIILIIIIVSLFSGLDMYLYSMLGSSQGIVLANLISGLPWFLLIAGVIFAAAIYPRLKIAQNKRFRYILSALLVLGILLYIADLGPVTITSGPCIQLVDDSSIAVVWTTNKKSTGYVEYGTDENNLKKLYSSKDGVIDANTTVHRIIIPLEGRKNLVYRVGSTRIVNYFQNSVDYGNTAVSTLKKFTDYRSSDSMAFYVLSDIHENTGIYKDFLSGSGYDFVVLDGDAVNSLDTPDTALNNILKPISEYTDGSKPFYLVRGNHETRGSYLRNLPDYLALPGDSFYYSFSFGPVYAAVLDSGEDKLDSHEEYAGLADFRTYRDNETKWLESLKESEGYKNALYRIAFIHIPLNEYEGKTDTAYLGDYQHKWRSLLNDMKFDALFSGHTHSPEAIEADGAEFGFSTFIGGGEYGKKGGYAAIRVEVSKDSMKIYYIGRDGSILNQYEIKTRGI